MWKKVISEIKFKLGVYCFVIFEKFINGGGLIDCLVMNKKEEVVENYVGRGKFIKWNDINVYGLL